LNFLSWSNLLYYYKEYTASVGTPSNVSDKFMIQAIEVDDAFDLSKFSELAGELSKRNMVQSIKIRANVNKDGNNFASNLATPERNLSSFASPPNRTGRYDTARMTAPTDEVHSNRPSVLGSTYENQNNVNALFQSATSGSREVIKNSIGSPGMNVDYKKKSTKN